MYTIGQISEMFGLPVSTLRYYDKQGLFPELKRENGIRKFTKSEVEALHVIECLKKSGLEIKDIKQFMQWCAEGAESYGRRKALFERQRANVEAEMAKLGGVLELLKYKCLYYEKAIELGSEEGLKELIGEAPHKQGV